MSNLLEQASLVMIPSGYAEDVVYSEIPLNGAGDLSFTRASDGTRINSAGLVEVCPWNLLTYSEDFSNVAWSKFNSTVTANVTTAPNGTLTADSLVENTATSQHLVFEAFVSIVTSYTFFCYIKPDTRTRAYLRTDTSVGTRRTLFDLTGAGSVVTLAHTSASISLLENGWYLCSIVFPEATAAGGRLVGIEGAVGTNISYTGNGLNAFYIWGAQLNEGSTAKPYFPTTDRLNVPRLTYQNGGGGCPSLLLEPQRTNLTLYSEDFSNAAFWAVTNSGTISANNEISPDGTQNADTLNAGAAFSQVQGAIGGTIGTVYTVSIYVKRISGTGNVFLRAVENVNTLISVTNEWQRFTATVTSTSTVIRIGIALATSGDAVAIWGGQIEVGAYPTTYIPTTTASATRVADSFSRNNIFTNGLITSSGGTWFVELKENLSLTPDTTGQGISFGDNLTMTSGNQLQIRSLNTNSRMTIAKRVAGSFTSLYTTTTDTTKIAIKWNGTTADVFVNGTKQVSATAFTATALEYLQTNILDSPKFISQMDLFPTPLTDAECIALTTL
jgi:hypothetical protein